MGFREKIKENEEEVIEETTAENVEETTTEGETTETETEDGEPVELEEWQKTEADEELKDGDKPKHEKSLKAKKKLKGLLTERETELTEQQKENERLRQENENLKAGSLKSSEPGQLKRPVKSDFGDEYGDVDESKYNAALDQYEDDRYDQRQAVRQAKAGQEAQQAAISEGAKAHYERAELLVETSNINPEVYKAADMRFRKTIDSVFPKKGDIYADTMLSLLGSGSEKVAFFVGNNEAARDKFQALLQKDATCLEAAMYLGTEKQRLNTNSPAKKVSRAKPPATTISGDAPASGVNGKLQKKYDQAHKAGDAGLAIKIKRQAKAAKVDTSSW